MNVLDGLVFLVLGWSAWRGYKRGLWLGIIGLSSIFIGIWIALQVGDEVREQFNLSVENTTFRILLFIAICLISTLLVNIGAWIVKRILRMTPLGVLDSVLGAALFLCISTVVLSISCWSVHKNEYVERLVNTSLVTTVLCREGKNITHWIIGWM